MCSAAPGSSRARGSARADRALPRNLRELVATSPWRSAIDNRFRCEPPVATTILGGNPAELMQCTRLVGGWAHVAMVALVNNTIWYADGVLPAAQVMERSIGVLAGVTRADAVAPTSGADALLASRLAAKAFSSGDVGQFDTLMAAGTRANLADNPGAAESAFRAALALQQKALGKDNPNTSTALMSLALQLSDEGRYAEADALFVDAGKLVPGAADTTAQARLLHYRGLDAMNQGQLERALTLLSQADDLYAAAVPADALAARPRPIQTPNAFTRAGQIRLGDLMPSQDLLTDPRAQAALLGLIEVRRNRAVVLRIMGQREEANALLKSAADLARGNGLSRPIVNARLYRTSGLTAAARGLDDQALADLLQSSTAFDRSLPGSKPLADTYLLRARQLVKGGKGDAALPVCRNAVQSLVALKAGTTPVLMASCLDVYAAAAQGQKDQVLLAEMFTAAQLAQGGVTSQQIAQATARLSENARDPKVAEAIRHRQDASARLSDLYRRRDDLAEAQRQGAAPSAASADLDKQIGDAQTALADADAALQAASPNYGQLVQEVVPAKDVFAALHPNEAFAAITLSDEDGWLFLLRDGTHHRVPDRCAASSRSPNWCAACAPASS